MWRCLNYDCIYAMRWKPKLKAAQVERERLAEAAVQQIAFGTAASRNRT
jgi:hypothetical protein